MAVYFSGVNTGRNYEVGQTYKMGGDSYVAQPDGSFTNQQTGRNFVGSSNPSADQTVSWYSDGDQYSSGRSMAAADYAPVREAIARAQAQAQLAAGAGSVVSGAALQAGTVKPTRSAGVTAAPDLVASAVSAGSGLLSSLWKAGNGLTKYDGIRHVIEQKPPASSVTQIHGSDVQRAVPLLGDLFWYYPNEHYPDVADFWEDHAGEPGEFVGGVQVIAAGLLNSIPRNAERYLDIWGDAWNKAVKSSSQRDYDRLGKIGGALGLVPNTDAEVLDLDPMRFTPMSQY